MAFSRKPGLAAVSAAGKGDIKQPTSKKAVTISAIGSDRVGKPLHVLSPEICEIFGDFGGKTSIQRSAPRWVTERYARAAAEFIRSLD